LVTVILQHVSIFLNHLQVFIKIKNTDMGLQMIVVD